MRLKYYKYFKYLTALPSQILNVQTLLLCVIFFSVANTAHSLELSFEWDPNTEPDIAGYRLFSREEGQNYDYNNPLWEGVQTTCTIIGIDDTRTYYFVARSFDIHGNESSNSVELVIMPSNQPPEIILGDVNGSGVVDLADVIVAIQVAANITPADSVDFRADVNEDLKVSIPEALYGLQRIAGLR